MTSRHREPPNWAARAALADNVRAARLAAGMSQEALAHTSGIARSYVSTVERGRANLALDHLVRLAGVLGVEPNSLVPTTAQIASARPAPGGATKPRTKATATSS